METIMLKEIKSEPELMKRCFETNKELIKEISQAINNFKPTNILIAARGTSLHSGMLAKYLFQLYYHLPVSIATPSVFTVYDGEVDLSKTLVIAISQSGKGKDIWKVVEKANKCNAFTLGITNTKGSIIANECKYNLWNDVDEAVSYAATKTYTSSLYLLISLIYELTGNDNLKLEDEKVINALNEGLSHYEEIKQLVPVLKDAENTLVMARGKDLSLAMELALKIKETSHYPVHAYPCSEFYHGPIVMVSEKTPTILFGIDKVTNDNIVKMIKDLKYLNAKTIAFTNNKEIKNEADYALYYDVEDKYAIFTSAIMLQLFTNE